MLWSLLLTYGVYGLIVQLLEEVRDEAGKYGTVEGIAVPRPPMNISQDEPSRVYIKFAAAEASSLFMFIVAILIDWLHQMQAIQGKGNLISILHLIAVGPLYET